MPSRPAVLAVLLLPALAVPGNPPPVVELFEDDARTLLGQLTHGGITGGEMNPASAETDDVFSGTTALRVAVTQRFAPDIKEWDFVITEKPKAGEYRYLRFAWKKAAPGGPIMLQFHTRKPVRDWIIRYYMGPGPPWASKVLAPFGPGEWVVVTRDLFKDFGAVTLGGIAFSPLEGGDGLFDHLLLGRTVEDLDRATAAALLRTDPKRPLTAERLKQLWADLGSPDEIAAESAVWALVAGRKEAVPFLLKSAVAPGRRRPRPVDEATVKPLIDRLAHYRYVTRAAAEEELVRLGDGVLPHLRKAAEAAEGERKVRLTAILDGWAARTGLDELRFRRAATVLRTVGTPEAKGRAAAIEQALPSSKDP
jgi:hypothetical protein